MTKLRHDLCQHQAFPHPIPLPINLFRAFRIGEFTRGMLGANECACVGKFFSVDCAPLCVSSESVRFRTVLSDPEHTIRHLPVARPRAPAFQSRCPPHRKRESEHRVSGCGVPRLRLRWRIASDPAWHSRPNGSTSEIRSKPRLSLRGRTS